MSYFPTHSVPQPVVESRYKNIGSSACRSQSLLVLARVPSCWWPHFPISVLISSLYTVDLRGGCVPVKEERFYSGLLPVLATKVRKTPVGGCSLCSQLNFNSSALGGACQTRCNQILISIRCDRNNFICHASQSDFY